MDASKSLSKIFEASEEIPFDDSSKIVLMSDCHRGDGSWADNFYRNRNLFYSALTHYNREKFTYIELGDGDELWENSELSDIYQVHKDVFWILRQFHKENRFYMIFGNHDIVKEDPKFIKDHMHYFYHQREEKAYPLFENIKVHEGLVLKHKKLNLKIFLVHGHQVDFFNYRLWKLGRFLARHIWRRLELFGVKDPTSAAKNYKTRKTVENRLTNWVIREEQMLIAGHTHKPVFPKGEDSLYFNDGSCVHPRCITAIEIISGNILLVKWQIKTKLDGTLYVAREVISGPRRLDEIYK